MVYNTQNYWLLELFPLSRILITRKHCIYYLQFWMMEKVHKPSNSAWKMCSS
jgi:hypothetical protein